MCAHGEFPVPAPATLKLLEGIPVYAKGEPFERTTPTGAALLKVFAEGYGPIPAGIVERTGYGLGDRESELPNLLQGILLKSDGFAGGNAGQLHHVHTGYHDHAHSHNHNHDHLHEHSHDHNDAHEHHVHEKEKTQHSG
jgi:uncharacterized protein (DUF111 family)